jgi:hypothetical protein
LNLNQELYREILNKRLPKREENDWIFMHDNAKPHTAKLTKQWLDNNTPDYIRDWPAISPENSLKKRIKKLSQN